MKKDTRVPVLGQRETLPKQVIPLSQLLQQQQQQQQQQHAFRRGGGGTANRSSRSNTPDVQLFKNKHAYDTHMKVRDSLKKQSIFEKADEYDPIKEMYASMERNRGRHHSKSVTDRLGSDGIVENNSRQSVSRNEFRSVSRNVSPPSHEISNEYEYLLGGVGNGNNSPPSPHQLLNSRNKSRSASPSVTLRNFKFQEKNESKINTIINANTTADNMIISEENRRIEGRGRAVTSNGEMTRGQSSIIEATDGQSSPNDDIPKKSFRKTLSNGVVTRRTLQPWALNGRIDTPKIKIANELQRISYTQRPASSNDAYWTRKSVSAPRERPTQQSAFGNLLQDAVAAAMDVIKSIDNDMLAIARASNSFGPNQPSTTMSGRTDRDGVFPQRDSRYDGGYEFVSSPSSFSMPFMSPIKRSGNFSSFRDEDEQLEPLPLINMSATGTSTSEEAVKKIVHLTYSDEFKSTVKDRTGLTTLKNFYLDPMAINEKTKTKVRKPPAPSTKSPLVRIDWTENTTGRPITRQICRKKFFHKTK